MSVRVQKWYWIDTESSTEANTEANAINAHPGLCLVLHCQASLAHGMTLLSNNISSVCSDQPGLSPAFPLQITETQAVTCEMLTSMVMPLLCK